MNLSYAKSWTSLHPLALVRTYRTENGKELKWARYQTCFSFQNSKSQHCNLKSTNSIREYTMHRPAKQSEVFLKLSLKLSPGTKQWWHTCTFLSLTLLNSLKCSHPFCSEISDHSRCWPVGQRKQYKTVQADKLSWLWVLDTVLYH